jgi:hypothetical protein
MFKLYNNRLELFTHEYLSVSVLFTHHKIYKRLIRL